MTTPRKILNTQGQTLLLALLIMAGVTAAGVGISTVVINQIRQSKNISDATQATYIAESVLEKSLYIVKEERKDVGAVLDIEEEEGEDSVIEKLKAINLEGLADSKYEVVEATSKVQETEVSVKENETYQIDLFDPDQQEGLGDINYIYISWDNNYCSINDNDYKDCFGKGEEWAEITWTSWGYNPWTFGEEEKKMIAASELEWRNINSTDCPSKPDFDEQEDYEKKPCYTINVGPVEYPTNYSVRVRALYGDLEGLEIKALKSDFNQITDINSWVVVKALGKAGGEAGASIQQALRVTAPWKVPMTGILNFTLLSEDDLIK